jgi:hypothetical protein
MPFGQEAKATVWSIDDTLKPVGVLTAAGLDVSTPFLLFFLHIHARSLILPFGLVH